MENGAEALERLSNSEEAGKEGDIDTKPDESPMKDMGEEVFLVVVFETSNL